jgi:hypothetical protein
MWSSSGQTRPVLLSLGGACWGACGDGSRPAISRSFAPVACRASAASGAGSRACCSFNHLRPRRMQSQRRSQLISLHGQTVRHIRDHDQQRWGLRWSGAAYPLDRGSARRCCTKSAKRRKARRRANEDRQALHANVVEFACVTVGNDQRSEEERELGPESARNRPDHATPTVPCLQRIPHRGYTTPL